MLEYLVAVNVSLAVLWTKPDLPREYDHHLISGTITEPALWAGGMNDDMRLWLVDKIETQVLFGERLIVLDRQGKWLKVAAAEQKTNLDTRGYPGWLPEAQVSRNPVYLQAQTKLPIVTVSAKTAWLYQDAAAKKRSIELSYQTRLPLLEEKGTVVKVGLPDGGSGYLHSSDVTKISEIVFRPENLVNEARHFLGLGYLWGGTSTFGFDCSGFAMRIYQSQGISIPRDAHDQAAGGIPVPMENLAPGDLLFFADRQGRGDIHHVGIYIGEGMMIHAPNSRETIKEDCFLTGDYGRDFWGARRYR